jgi:muramidase (phage lysozyme)
VFLVLCSPEAYSNKQINNIDVGKAMAENMNGLGSKTKYEYPMAKARDEVKSIFDFTGYTDPTPEYQKSPQLSATSFDIDSILPDINTIIKPALIELPKASPSNNSLINLSSPPVINDVKTPSFIKEGSIFKTYLKALEAEDYNTIFSDAQKNNTPFKNTDVTKMSVGQVLDFVKQDGAFHKYNQTQHNKDTTAVGKYQIVGATLRDLEDRGILEDLGISKDTKFNAATQDAIAAELAKRRVVGKTDDEARIELRNEWEGFNKLNTKQLDSVIEEIRQSTIIRPRPRPEGLMVPPSTVSETTPTEVDLSLIKPKARPEGLTEGLMSPIELTALPRPKPRPNSLVPESTVVKVEEALPEEIKASVDTSEPKTNEELNTAIFDATAFTGTIKTPTKGEDPISWIAANAYGLDENDPTFQKAFKGITKMDPSKTPWCAAFAGYILKNAGVVLPKRALSNPDAAFNYLELGDEVYNYNPTTNKSYGDGKFEDVKPGDIIVFNNATRKKGGDFAWGEGHISFVVDTKPDGSIVAVGGNQGGGRKVTTTEYTTAIMKKHYKGGYTIRRLTDSGLASTPPDVIASITKDISEGGAER